MRKLFTGAVPLFIRSREKGGLREPSVQTATVSRGVGLRMGEDVREEEGIGWPPLLGKQ